MLVTLGHCNTSAMNVSVLHLVFEPAPSFVAEGGSRLRKLDRPDGFCERCEVACRHRWRHGCSVLRRFPRSLHMLEEKSGDEEQERRLPDAAVPVDHFLRGAHHPERVGLSAAGRVEDERLVPHRAHQRMGAKFRHETERMRNAPLLQVSDRGLVYRMAGIAEREYQS